MSQLYDVDQFEPAPSPELLCAICQNVLFNPVECLCRHVFCSACIDTWLAEMASCPTCRENVTKESLRPVVPLLQNLLNGLQLRCANHGCSELVSMENHQAHVRGCDFQTLPCPHKGCKKMLRRKDLEPHQALCEHRLIKCSEWCGMEVAENVRSGHNCKIAVLGVLQGEVFHDKVSGLQSNVSDIKQQNNELTKVADELRSRNVELERELAAVKAQLDSNSHILSSDDDIINSSIVTPPSASFDLGSSSSDDFGGDLDTPSPRDILQQTLNLSDSLLPDLPQSSCESVASSKDKSSDDSELEVLPAASSSFSSSSSSSPSIHSEFALDSSDEDVTEIMVRQSSLWLRLNADKIESRRRMRRRKRAVSDNSSDSPTAKRLRKTKERSGAVSSASDFSSSSMDVPPNEDSELSSACD